MKPHLTLGLLLLIAFNSEAQKVKPLRTTLGTTGGSFNQGNSEIYILQSVGQSSVIGTFKQKSNGVRQGFIQPMAKILGSKASTLLNLRAYPNPTTGKITIQFQEEFSGTAEIVIYDLAGKIMHAETTDEKVLYTTDISQLQSGLYFLEIIADKKSARLKILKNN